MPGPVPTRVSRQLGPGALEVDTVEVFAMDVRCRLVNMVGCIFSSSRRVPNRPIRPVKDRTALVAFANGLRLNLELVRELVEDLPCMLIKRGKLETGGLLV